MYFIEMLRRLFLMAWITLEKEGPLCDFTCRAFGLGMYIWRLVLLDPSSPFRAHESFVFLSLVIECSLSKWNKLLLRRRNQILKLPLRSDLSAFLRLAFQISRA